MNLKRWIIMLLKYCCIICDTYSTMQHNSTCYCDRTSMMHQIGFFRQKISCEHHLPWTTGFGIGYRLKEWVNIRVAPKWHILHNSKFRVLWGQIFLDFCSIKTAVYLKLIYRRSIRATTKISTTANCPLGKISFFFRYAPFFFQNFADQSRC